LDSRRRHRRCNGTGIEAEIEQSPQRVDRVDRVHRRHDEATVVAARTGGAPTRGRQLTDEDDIRILMARSIETRGERVAGSTIDTEWLIPGATSSTESSTS
jgi:hypothetical protein